MNLGKRIEERLNELEWGRSKLYELVPELSPAALSALIKRDSKRCELDVKIAKALGVHLAWLNSGEFQTRFGGFFFTRESSRVDF